MRRWDIAKCLWNDTGDLTELLNDGWEPFAVSVIDYETIWLRRLLDREHARAASGDPRPRLEAQLARLSEALRKP